MKRLSHDEFIKLFQESFGKLKWHQRLRLKLYGYWLDFVEWIELHSVPKQDRWLYYYLKNIRRII